MSINFDPRLIQPNWNQSADGPGTDFNDYGRALSGLDNVVQATGGNGQFQVTQSNGDPNWTRLGNFYTGPDGNIQQAGDWGGWQKRDAPGRNIGQGLALGAGLVGGLGALGALGGGAAGAVGVGADGFVGEGALAANGTEAALAGAAPAYTTAAADSALVGGAATAGSVPATVDLLGAGGLGTVATGASPGLLGTVEQFAKAHPFLSQLAGKGLGAALVGAIAGGGKGGAAEVPSHNLDALPPATSSHYVPFAAPADQAAPASRPGHTRGPSGAVNLQDPSAALFGYGAQHHYYQPEAHADGGSVGTNWLDNLGGLADAFYPKDETPAAVPAPPDDASQSILDLFKSPTGPGVSLGGVTAPPESTRVDYPNPQIKDIPAEPNWLERLMNGDKATSQQARFGIGALGLLGSLFQNRNKPRGYLSAADIQAQLKSPFSTWTPQQQANFNRYFYAPSKTFVPPPSNTNTHYAHGGPTGGALQEPSGVHYVAGPDSGQADTVHAKLSHGEYVFDADVVSALGDGNNAAGARKLDEMREAVRAHKRSAPTDRIPPQAHHPLEYLNRKG